MITIGTHSGVFHSDEVVAIALMSFMDSLEITRSRSEIVLGECEMLVDVGGEYDPLNSKYDHHHFKCSDPFYGLSSAGLVYKDLRPYFKTTGELEDLDAFIEAVDARDTRVGYNESNVYEPVFEAITALNNIDPVNHASQATMFDVLVERVSDIIDALLNKNTVKYSTTLAVLEKAAEQETKNKEEVFAIRAKTYVELDDVIVSKFFPTWRKISSGTGKPFIMPGDEDSQFKVMVDTNTRQIATTRDQVFTHINGFISIVSPSGSSTHMGIAFTDGSLIEVPLHVVRRALNG